MGLDDQWVKRGSMSDFERQGLQSLSKSHTGVSMADLSPRPITDSISSKIPIY